MANSLFNTPFETMLRTLLLMESAGRPMNKDEIAALDFIAIYGRSCGLLDSNLNGDNRFSFAEFARKRELVSEALCDAVKRDLVNVTNSKEGFLFDTNYRGHEAVANIGSSYAERYKRAATSVLAQLGGRSGLELLELINLKANEAKEDGYGELLD